VIKNVVINGIAVGTHDATATSTPLWHFGGWSNVWQGLMATLISSVVTVVVARKTIRWTLDQERELRAEDRRVIAEERMQERSRQAAGRIGDLLSLWAQKIGEVKQTDEEGLKATFTLGRRRAVELEALEPPLQGEHLVVLVVGIRKNLLAWHTYVLNASWRSTATRMDSAVDYLRDCAVLFQKVASGYQCPPEDAKALSSDVTIDMIEHLASR